MGVMDILSVARKTIDSHIEDRDSGEERTMKQIVDGFNLLTGQDLTEHDGYIFMVCLKLVRMERDKGLMDNYVDAAAYLQLASETVQQKEMK